MECMGKNIIYSYTGFGTTYGFCSPGTDPAGRPATHIEKGCSIIETRLDDPKNSK